jgi:hypothetical protein
MGRFNFFVSLGAENPIPKARGPSDGMVIGTIFPNFSKAGPHTRRYSGLKNSGKQQLDLVLDIVFLIVKMILLKLVY